MKLYSGRWRAGLNQLGPVHSNPSIGYILQGQGFYRRANQSIRNLQALDAVHRRNKPKPSMPKLKFMSEDKT